jgi:hypothetical protein
MDAEEGTALVLDNFFPEAESIRIRRGFTSFATGMSGDVQTLMTFTGATASKLFAANGTNIYNVTSGGAVGAAEVSSLTNAKWQDTMFSTAAGQFLVCCNGADDPRNYNGTTWSTPSITGVTASTFVHVTAHKFRLWFTQLNSTDLWYLPVNSIAGAAVKFPVGGLLKLGGYIMACSTWSVDAGDGMDDMFVAWSSEGEAIVYQGTDPDASNTWQLVGVYRSGKPIGRRCMVRVGGDLAMLSEDGVLPVTHLLEHDRATTSGKALTATIRQAYADATQRSRDVFGWQMVVHPVRNMALVNVPASSIYPVYQFALNTLTGAWARFVNQDAQCWGTYDNKLYFGGTGDGKVWRADNGGDDGGEAIRVACLPSYTHLGQRGRLKHVKLVQPIFTTDVIRSSPNITVAVDYELPDDLASTENISESYFTWDVSEWDGPNVWFGLQVKSGWRGSANIGTVISPYTTLSIDASDSGVDFKYAITGWGIVYELGGIL